MIPNISKEASSVQDTTGMVDLKLARVVSVDDPLLYAECLVAFLEGNQIRRAILGCSREIGPDKYLVVPKVGSLVWVACPEGNRAYVVVVDESQEVVVNGGKHGGEIKIKELTAQLNKLLESHNALVGKYNDLVDKFNRHGHSPGPTTGGFNAFMGTTPLPVKGKSGAPTTVVGDTKGVTAEDADPAKANENKDNDVKKFERSDYEINEASH